MFALETKAFVRDVGASLVPNGDLNARMDLLTLVKVREGSFWRIPRYRSTTCSLVELMEDEEEVGEFNEYHEEVLVEDFTSSVETSGRNKAEAGGDLIGGKAEASLGSDSLDGFAAPVSLRKRKANMKKIRSKLGGKKFRKERLAGLRLGEGEKLAFVHQTVYNTAPVTIVRKAKRESRVSASCQKMLNMLLASDTKEEKSFTVPEESTFAYGLTEVVLKDEKIEIACEPWTHNESIISAFVSDGVSSDVWQRAKEGIEAKEHLLDPLTDFTEPARRDLTEKLCKILESKDDLCLLEETLQHLSKGFPPSPFPAVSAVLSFTELLQAPGVSTEMTDAVYLLVAALDALPSGMPALLAAGEPESLRILRQLVEDLKVCGLARLPEISPAPLQEGGRLRWAADLLCFDVELPENVWGGRPEVLLEVMALAVIGLAALKC